MPDSAGLQYVVLPCGDDGVFTNRAEYITRCPIFDPGGIKRTQYRNGFMNLLTCPNGDRDFYAIYLLPEETVLFEVLYKYDTALPRNLDARVWRWDYATSLWRDDVAVGLSTNDNEQLTVSTATGSNNPQGYYYLEVYGATYQDLNYYTVSFTLNATQI